MLLFFFFGYNFAMMNVETQLTSLLFRLAGLWISSSRTGGVLGTALMAKVQRGG